jgi:hypothetical protein
MMLIQGRMDAGYGVAQQGKCASTSIDDHD